MSRDDQFCFAWIPPEAGTAAKTRAALVRDARWNSGDVISVSFVDGDPDVQARVRAVAEDWTKPGLANVVWNFRNPADTLIRISFKYAGSWSVLGTACKRIPRGQPTMNYGWLTPDSTDEDLRRVVLHEFGHALGLIHEHQNPSGGIKWNKDQVYRDLSGPPNNWSKETIDHNMFDPYNAKETNFTATDPHSIMMYPIPKSWTLDGLSVGLNGELSENDRRFIKNQYA